MNLLAVKQRRYKALLREEYEGFSEDVDSDDGGADKICNKGNLSRECAGVADGQTGADSQTAADRGENQKAIIGSNRHKFASSDLTRQLQAELNQNSNRNPFKTISKRLRGSTNGQMTADGTHHVTREAVEEAEAAESTAGRYQTTAAARSHVPSPLSFGNRAPRPLSEPVSTASVYQQRQEQQLQQQRYDGDSQSIGLNESDITQEVTLEAESAVTMPPSYSFHHPASEISAVSGIASAESQTAPYHPYYAEWLRQQQHLHQQHLQQQRQQHMQQQRHYRVTSPRDDSPYSDDRVGFGASIAPGTYEGGNAARPPQPSPLFGYPRRHGGEEEEEGDANAVGVAISAATTSGAVGYPASPAAALAAENNRNANARMRSGGGVGAATAAGAGGGVAPVEKNANKQQQQTLEHHLEQQRLNRLEQQRRQERASRVVEVDRGSSSPSSQRRESTSGKQQQQQQQQEVQRGKQQQQQQQNQNQIKRQRARSRNGEEEEEESDGVEECFFSRTAMLVAALALVVGVALGLSGQRHSMAFAPGSVSRNNKSYVSENPNPMDLNLPGKKELCSCESCPKQRGRSIMK